MNVCTQPSSWNPAVDWTGPEPEVYWSFDCVDSLVLMEGSAEATAVVVAGKVRLRFGVISVHIY